MGNYWSIAIAFFTGVITLGLLLTPFSLLVAAGLIRQRRTPASSVTWLLAILLLPFIGIPLYWLFGNRKIDRIIQRKSALALQAVDHAAFKGAPTDALTQAVRHFGEEGLTDGNTLRLHADGETAFADLMALIDAAKTSIEIETFILKSDRTGRAIIDRLIKRAKDGVKVRLLIDGLGSFAVARAQLRALRRAGGEAQFFLPIWRFTLWNRGNLRNHRKIAVFDGGAVFAGGRNLADEYLGAQPSPRRWSDLSFVIEGPAARLYRQVFASDWTFATRRRIDLGDARPASASPADGAIVQVVPSGPDVAEDELFEGFLSLVFAAQRRLWIVTPYFIPTEMLALALRIAAQRGIDLRIIVPEKSDQRLPDLARAEYLRDLQRLGAKVALFPSVMLHAKAVLVDDAAAVIGSANFDSRSMFLNFEVSSAVYSAPEIAAVAGWIETLLQASRPFDATRQHYAFVEGIARLLASVL